MTNHNEAFINDTMAASTLSSRQERLTLEVAIQRTSEALRGLGDTSTETAQVLRTYLKGLRQLYRRKPLIHNGKAYRK